MTAAAACLITVAQYNQEFIRFLNALERDIPAGKVVHAIMDNYATTRPRK